MTKINQFFAEVMGKKNQFEDIQCPVCGYFCTGNGGIGCIDKPFLVHLKDDSFYASLNGETSFEVRKWFEKNEPEVWEDYLDSFYSTVGYYEWLGIDGTTSVNIFNAQLSIDNFYNYLIEHFGEWGYKDGICKYPEAEKIIKGEK